MTKLVGTMQEMGRQCIMQRWEQQCKRLQKYTEDKEESEALTGDFLTAYETLKVLFTAGNTTLNDETTFSNACIAVESQLTKLERPGNFACISKHFVGHSWYKARYGLTLHYVRKIYAQCNFLTTNTGATHLERTATWTATSAEDKFKIFEHYTGIERVIMQALACLENLRMRALLEVENCCVEAMNPIKFNIATNGGSLLPCFGAIDSIRNVSKGTELTELEAECLNIVCDHASRSLRWSVDNDGRIKEEPFKDRKSFTANEKVGRLVQTVAHGMALSCGGILFLAGDERVCGRHTHVMLHEPRSGGSYGTLQKKKERVGELCDFKRDSARWAVERTLTENNGDEKESISQWIDVWKRHTNKQYLELNYETYPTVTLEHVIYELMADNVYLSAADCFKLKISTVNPDKSQNR
tara:strand:+ start:425 stop:1663 length:1239 start_codon:yes stop_codon:yes gene_type:complete